MDNLQPSHKICKFTLTARSKLVEWTDRVLTNVQGCAEPIRVSHVTQRTLQLILIFRLPLHFLQVYTVSQLSIGPTRYGMEC